MNVHSLQHKKYGETMGKRIQILLATEKLLAERGFYGLSMKVLAQEAGVAAGTIYRYFDNKEMLMLELHQHIRFEGAATIFNGWSAQNSPKQQYDLLWRNAFNGVLNNPQRLTVIEMLYFIPNDNKQPVTPFEDDAFLPLVEFYQQGIDEKRFHDWPIPALVALSFDSAMHLAKKVSKQCLQLNEQTLLNVRNASWQAIQL